MAKGFIVIYGPPGVGKSTEALISCQKSMLIASAPNNAMFYKQWLKTPEGIASGCTLPVREFVYDVYTSTDSAQLENGEPKVTMEFGPDGMPLMLPTRLRLETLVNGLLAKAAKDRAAGTPLSYDNLIIDEAGTFWSRIFEEVAATSLTAGGKQDPRAAYGTMGAWSSAFCNKLRMLLALGMNVVLIAHDAEPDATKGKQGGPKFPSTAIRSQICADADYVIMRDVEDAQVAPEDLLKPGAPDPKKMLAQRLWRVHASTLWASKARGIPDQDFEKVRAMTLTQILTHAGVLT